MSSSEKDTSTSESMIQEWRDEQSGWSSSITMNSASSRYQRHATRAVVAVTKACGGLMLATALAVGPRGAGQDKPTPPPPASDNPGSYVIHTRPTAPEGECWFRISLRPDADLPAITPPPAQPQR